MDAEGCSHAACSYFFTVRLEDHRCESLIEHIDALCLAFRACRDRYPFAMTAGVILPDHLHCVLSLPSADAPRDAPWQLIKDLFESAVDCGPDLWRPDFDERRIEDDAELSRQIDDIHADPVRHGLVGSPSDWPYSSFHAYVAHGLRPAHWRADGGAPGLARHAA
jgi:putative transposase